MVSNHSEKSLRSFYPEAKGRDVRVFYSPSTSGKLTLERKYDDKYFLMVSGNRWEKNNLRAIIALDRLFSMGYLDGFRAKITGVKSASCYRYKIKNVDRFDYCGYVDDTELEQLYHDAYCLIYPSLNEGFGYPPLEAMHYGVPVIASPFTSIPEVCGDAVIYFNPFSIEEIMSRILMMADPDIHAKYSERGNQRYFKITERQNADLDGLIDYIYTIAGMER
jgi:glycosyltransferase involved in cell wall biosynthesis